MFVGAHHLVGDPAALAAGRERITATWPPESLELHVCAVREHGIVAVNGCPSRSDFEAFDHSAQFRGALARVGLSEPRLVPFGEVFSTIQADQAVTP